MSYAAVSCQLGHVTIGELEKDTGEAGINAFDAHISDFISKVIDKDKVFPPLIFFFEPLKDRATNMVIMDMPKDAPAGEVINTMTRKYIAENQSTIEKVILITGNLMYKLDLPEEIMEKIQQARALPSSLPPELVDHGLIIVSQQRDEDESTHDIRVLRNEGYVDVSTIAPFDMSLGHTESRFGNLFDQEQLDKLNKEATFLKMKLDPDKASDKELIDDVDNMVKNIFNRKFN